MSIKAVLFDLDDTLLWDERSVKEAFEAACAYAAERTGTDPAKLEEETRKAARALYESFDTFAFTQMIGINPFEGLWARFSEGEQPEFRRLAELAPGYRAEAWTRGLKACGVDDPALGRELGERFAAERRNRPHVYEETFEVLDQLKGRFKLLLLTNGSPDLQKEKIASVPQLAGYFDHIVISGEFGEGKPSVRIFAHAAERLGIRAEEGIMVGDKLTTDILGSSRFGMKNVWINRRRLPLSGDVKPDYEISNLRELLEIPGLAAYA
jgi:putative hydrolase of the HAD superfamily